MADHPQRQSNPANQSATEHTPEQGPGVRFRHERIDANPPSGRLFLCETADLTGNSRPDVIVGGMGAEHLDTPVPGVTVDRASKLGVVLGKLGIETDLFWYENPGWERHAMTDATGLHLLGGTLVEFDDGGATDLVVGQGFGRDDVYWFERPDDPRDPWPHHRIRSDFQKYHDLAFGDVDDDGAPELVGVSQDSETVFYYDVPDEPRQMPWPDRTKHVVDTDVSIEGIEVVDIDGDGQTEIVAGPHIYHRHGETWERETIVTGWDWTRLAVADLDGDGELEVVLSEGDSPTLGTHPGRVAWFDPPDWEQHRLRDDLFNPHTLQIADFDGDGRPDVYVAEMGLGANDDPKHLLYRNRGGGEFTEHVVSRGVPTHEANAVDLTGNGRPDIVGKSYEGDTHVDVWYNEG